MTSKIVRQQCEFYNQYGELYTRLQQEFGNGEPEEDRLIMRRMLAERHCSGFLVEIGCGAGHDLRAWCELGASEVQAYDCSDAMRQIAEKQAKTLSDEGLNVSVAWMSGTWGRIVENDSSVDFIVGRYSLHLAEDMDVAFRESARVLLPGGWMAFSVPHPEYHAHMVREGRSLDGVLWSSLFGGQITVPNPVRDNMEQYYLAPARPYFDQFECVPYRDPAVMDLGEGVPTGLVCAFRKK